MNLSASRSPEGLRVRLPPGHLKPLNTYIMKVLHYTFCALCATCIAAAFIAGAAHQLAVAAVAALMAAVTKPEGEKEAQR